MLCMHALTLQTQHSHTLHANDGLKGHSDDVINLTFALRSNSSAWLYMG